MRDDELEQLLIAEAPRLLGLARRLAPDGIDAADLVQDTAGRAWAGRAQVTDRPRLDLGERCARRGTRTSGWCAETHTARARRRLGSRLMTGAPGMRPTVEHCL
jgi:Sigma-70 region 2